MSGSNPFRRSLKTAEAVRGADPAPRPQNDDTTITSSRRFPSLDIEVPPLVQRPSKHKTVRIASPPATTPISPASFPSEPPSPLFTRAVQSGSPPPSVKASPGSHDSQTDDPFVAESSDGEEDPIRGAEVLQNTRRNTGISTGLPQQSEADSSDAVSRTLARFSSRPQRPSTSGDGARAGPSESVPGKAKQPMDVNAFTRLLMTGRSVNTNSKAGSSTSNSQAQPGPISDSSSNTDTASVSKQSIFEPLPPLQTDTPRTSQDSSSGEREEDLQRLVINDERKKPPPPKTRHGKLIKANPAVASSLDNAPEHPISKEEVASFDTSTFAASEDLNNPLPQPPLGNMSIPANTGMEGTIASSAAAVKRPPTPPLSRRKSQKSTARPELSRDTSSKQSLGLTSDLPSPGSTTPKIPPAPPSRRGNRNSTGSTSGSQAIIPDHSPNLESQSESSFEKAMNTDSKSMPSPPLARHASSSSTISNKRLGRPPTGSAVPPPPPPRRNRGSSRSSVEAQRPATLSTLNDTAKTSEEYGHVSSENSNIGAGTSNAKDILADLAALQREVDDLRQKQRRE